MTDCEWSSGNIFKDLNVSNPQTELLKTTLIEAYVNKFYRQDLRANLYDKSLEELLVFLIEEKFTIIIDLIKNEV